MFADELEGAGTAEAVVAAVGVGVDPRVHAVEHVLVGVVVEEDLVDVAWNEAGGWLRGGCVGQTVVGFLHADLATTG